VEDNCVKQTNATRSKPEELFRAASGIFLLRIQEDRRDPDESKENPEASKDMKGQENIGRPGRLRMTRHSREVLGMMCYYPRTRTPFMT
jgi:hypothetical protein